MDGKQMDQINYYYNSAKDIFLSAVDAVNPYNKVINFTETIRSEYETGNYNKLLVTGFGKAAYSMALAIEDRLYHLITDGVVITKYGHAHNKDARNTLQKIKKIRVFEAGHPVPDRNGLKATDEVIRLVKDNNKRTFMVNLISGGGSALFVSPYYGISLGEKQRATGVLLKAGANIFELNTVRKHISRVKGGRFAEIAYPASMLTLILSDVIGDRLDVIASGPTVPDMTSFLDAIKVLNKYGLNKDMPPSIINTLQKGLEGSIPETPKAGDRIFEGVINIIIGSNTIALRSAQEKARKLGFHTEILFSDLTGEARDAGRLLAGKAKTIKYSKRTNKPVCLLSGGETTVTVKGTGKGGRNTELALAFSIDIEGIDGIYLLSAGTDGTDGPTDAAGAFADGTTVITARGFGLNPEEHLKNNDSYTFFKKINSLFITGPTKTNVMDIQILLIP